MSDPAPDDAWAGLGPAIRARRHANGLTLVELADRSGLSQPFLSQVENGRARPSMSSLARVASALDTTPQALFGNPLVASAPLVARATGPEVTTIASDGESLRRLLLPGNAPFHVVELVGMATDFLEPWQHHGFEALYVVTGPIDVEVDGVVNTLATGDFLSYPAHLPHRYRSPVGIDARALLIETQLGAVADGAHHAASSSSN